MRPVPRAHQTRDLITFEKRLRDYREELSSDPTIQGTLKMRQKKVTEAVADIEE
ncbi:hypothetical protein DFH94DRAFT_698166 [Russula ochroleuca]|uniref:Uncharacterized protein n=1 Tax=Russula ochroleuca TaxID=152965 RepID=A0A9P5JWD4_9AGAM|nr:hypothetical protein DFH94DRAFT_698166 [Russula ochroleuca]